MMLESNEPDVFSEGFHPIHQYRTQRRAPGIGSASLKTGSRFFGCAAYVACVFRAADGTNRRLGRTEICIFSETNANQKGPIYVENDG